MLSNDELNARVAEALGWCLMDGMWWCGDCYSPEPWGDELPKFSVSHDAFHTHVLPALEKLGLMEAWAEEVASRMDTDHITQYPHPTDTISAWLAGVSYAGLAACLAASPDTLTDAAIAVMKGQDDYGN